MGPLTITNKSHFDEDDAIVVTGENANAIFGLHIAEGQWSYWDLAEEEIISIPRHLQLILQETEIEQWYSDSVLRTRLEAIFATTLASRKRDVLSESTSSAMSTLYQTARWVSGVPFSAKGGYRGRRMKINTLIDYALCHGQLEKIQDIKLLVNVVDSRDNKCARTSLALINWLYVYTAKYRLFIYRTLHLIEHGRKT
ncbi:hypothetical protein DTO027B9_5067 [Paecilomyces variotii]|nr:hypothetical protein DTO027B9_5067 [Paecilomyces variotii]